MQNSTLTCTVTRIFTALYIQKIFCGRMLIWTMIWGCERYFNASYAAWRCLATVTSAVSVIFELSDKNLPSLILCKWVTWHIDSFDLQPNSFLKNELYFWKKVMTRSLKLTAMIVLMKALIGILYIWHKFKKYLWCFLKLKVTFIQANYKWALCIPII